MTKVITLMDDADEVMRKRKVREENDREVTTKMQYAKKINWDQWFGVLKGGEERAKEMQEEARRLREKISRDVRERIKRVKK